MGETAKNYRVEKSESLSKCCEPRYVLVDAKTGEVLDDAQGYGYKSVEKAHAAYAYKFAWRG
ncbi:MAG: hypothetical protein LUE86_06880 [Clostridiales bacterium]|nr:hypothetical protein [Clostridiales bacterium]